MSLDAVWVVPCYDEVARLDVAAFTALVDERADVTVLFVDDGSRDGTLALLRRLAESRPGRLRCHALDGNHGKAEAVRLGLSEALSLAPVSVGYLDADLATPPSEMARLLDVLRARDADVVLGTRVSMLGRRIERNHARHYLGRVFASAASVTLGLHVYDTQCGAKVFRATEALVSAIQRPFLSRWAFDVELLGRLLVPEAADVAPVAVERLIEEPLLEWRDVPGSKLSATSMVGAALDLARIAADLRHRRSRGG